MPKYSPETEEMDSLYESAQETPETPEPEMESEMGPEMEPEEEPETIDQEEQESESAVVSNKVLSPGGEPLKEGDKIILTVVKNYGDESEVKYATESSASSVKPPGDGMAGAEAELEAMDMG